MGVSRVLQYDKWLKFKAHQLINATQLDEHELRSVDLSLLEEEIVARMMDTIEQLREYYDSLKGHEGAYQRTSIWMWENRVLRQTPPPGLGTSYRPLNLG